MLVEVPVIPHDLERSKDAMPSHPNLLAFANWCIIMALVDASYQVILSRDLAQHYRHLDTVLDFSLMVKELSCVSTQPMLLLSYLRAKHGMYGVQIHMCPLWQQTIRTHKGPWHRPSTSRTIFVSSHLLAFE